MKNALTIVITLCIVLIPLSTIKAQNSYETVFSSASKDINSCLQDKGDLKMAVTGIRTLEGGQNGLTLWMAESLTSELAKKKNLHVLERGRLDEIVKENGLSFSDLFDPSKAKRVGKLLSADIMVNGTVTKIGGEFDLNLRVVDCELGNIIQGCGYRGNLKAGKGLMELWNKNRVLTVSIYPQDAEAGLYIDGKPAGATAQSQNVISLTSIEPGRHELMG